MCPGTCADFLCGDCRKAAQDDKRAAFDAQERVKLLEAALLEASTMALHWSSRAKQKKFRELLGGAGAARRTG